MKAVKLRKKERASLLLLRIPVLRAASDTNPHAKLRLGKCVLEASSPLTWKAS